MSYELINQSLEICKTFSRQTWVKALELARLYGWQPSGTRPPSFLDFCQLGAEWHGTYLTNDGQVVKAEDAFCLAAALERSLDDIPDASEPIDWSSKFWLEDPLPEWFSPAERAIIEEGLVDGLLDIIGTHPLEYFAGAEKQYLIEFIRFCRLGSFEIV
ncbi:MAG TPA: hypothetical protein VK206_27715 [Anaerolineales bacterium]|nr:hypothetical protein [Anaerolineales bacterium]